MVLLQLMKARCRRSQCLLHPTSQGLGPHGRSFSKEILYCSSASNHSSQCLVLGGYICPGWLKFGVHSSPAPAGDMPVAAPALHRTVPSLTKVHPASMMIYQCNT